MGTKFQALPSLAYWTVKTRIWTLLSGCPSTMTLNGVFSRIPLSRVCAPIEMPHLEVLLQSVALCPDQPAVVSSGATVAARSLATSSTGATGTSASPSAEARGAEVTTPAVASRAAANSAPPSLLSFMEVPSVGSS